MTLIATPTPTVPSTPDPLAPLNELGNRLSTFVDRFFSALGSVFFGLLAFGVAALFVYLWVSNKPYSTGGKLGYAGGIVVACVAGGWFMVRAYNTLNDATNGGFAQFLTILVPLLPFLIPLVVLLTVLNVSSGRRY